MFAGHFGVAAAVKSKAQHLPLWSLLVSSQLLDIAFFGLFFMGTEGFGTPIIGGRGTVIHAEYSHSLIGALLLSLLAYAFAAHFWGKEKGTVIGLVTFSHWILDLLVHMPDLPIFPGNFGDLPLLGFGLWRFSIASLLIEGLLIIIGAILYLRFTVKSSNTKKVSLNGMIVVIFLMMSFIFGI